MMEFLRKGNKWHKHGEPVETFPIQIAPSEVRDRRAEIPLEWAETAYKEYVQHFGDSQTIEKLAERGGFSIGEVAMLLSWRVRRLEKMTNSESLEYEEGPEKECGQHAGLVRYHGDECPMCRAMDLLHRSKQNIEACMQNIPFKEVGATPYTPPLVEEIEEFIS